MRIALIQPDSPYLFTPTAFPNLGLLYISEYLKRAGYAPSFYDLTGGRFLPDIRAEIIAFSCQITQWPEVVKMKNRLKVLNPHAKFIIHDQDQFTMPGRRLIFLDLDGRQLAGVGGREVNFELAPLPQFTVDVDESAMPLDDPQHGG